MFGVLAVATTHFYNQRGTKQKAMLFLNKRTVFTQQEEKNSLNVLKVQETITRQVVKRMFPFVRQSVLLSLNCFIASDPEEEGNLF